MKKTIYFIIILLILTYGLFLRINYHEAKGFNTDEWYQLSNMQRAKFTDIFSRTSLYGDHTSFPGEMILHYPFMEMAGVIKSPVIIDNANLRVDNVTKHQLATILFPKGVVTTLGVIVFMALCFREIRTWTGVFIAVIIFTFHPHLIRHGLAFRPYGILPELAIFNFFLSYIVVRKLNRWVNLIYYPLAFFTCIYHAYGILIAGLPFLFQWIMNKTYRPSIPAILVILASIGAWCYYASFSTFGMTPNIAQSQVSPFAFASMDIFVDKMIGGSFGSLTLYTMIAPVILFTMIKYTKDLLLLGLLVALPIALIILVDIKTHYWIVPRQWIWVLPFFCIFVGKQMDYIRESL